VFLHTRTLHSFSKITTRLKKTAQIANSTTLLYRRSHSGNVWPAVWAERFENNQEADWRGKVKKCPEEEASENAPTLTRPDSNIIFLQDNMEWLKAGGKRFHNISEIKGRIGRMRARWKEGLEASIDKKCNNSQEQEEFVSTCSQTAWVRISCTYVCCYPVFIHELFHCTVSKLLIRKRYYVRFLIPVFTVQVAKLVQFM
jgi:hypothetical protein